MIYISPYHTRVDVWNIKRLTQDYRTIKCR
nr:MAG TPA: hypothetical protein [Caudoviricetes sp.]